MIKTFRDIKTAKDLENITLVQQIHKRDRFLEDELRVFLLGLGVNIDLIREISLCGSFIEFREAKATRYDYHTSIMSVDNIVFNLSDFMESSGSSASAPSNPVVHPIAVASIRSLQKYHSERNIKIEENITIEGYDFKVFFSKENGLFVIYDKISFGFTNYDIKKLRAFGKLADYIEKRVNELNEGLK